jgi:hypothetical protein
MTYIDKDRLLTAIDQLESEIVALGRADSEPTQLGIHGVRRLITSGKFDIQRKEQ